MTEDKFLTNLKHLNAKIIPIKDDNFIEITNILLKKINLPTMPDELIKLYKNIGNIMLAGSIILSIDNSYKYSLYNLNLKLQHIQKLNCKTIFGISDLFYFAYDKNNNYYMLDNTYLNIVDESKDLYQIVINCLTIGII